MWDFAVVGAGPAGSRFAQQAATKGYDVLLLEQGSVGDPLACSGHVSQDLWEYVDAPREQLLQNEIRGARFHTEWKGYTEGIPFYQQEPISGVIDRKALDRQMAKQATTAGAVLKTDHSVISVSEGKNHVRIESRTQNDVEKFNAKMVIGCDGPQSRVRSEIGLPEPEQFLHGVFGHSSKPDTGDFVDVHLTVPSFFAWRIPRGQAGVEYGVGAPPESGVKQQYNQLCTVYDVNPEHTYSGVIPIGPPDTVTGHRTALIGDAAAQTKPFTGGGILYGLACADHAAQTLDPENPATTRQYESQWRDDLAIEISLGKLIQRAYNLPKQVQRAGMHIFAGEIGVDMDRPTTLLSKEQIKSMLN